MWVGDVEGRERVSPQGELLQSVLMFDLQVLQMATPVPPHVSRLSRCFCTKLPPCETSSSCLSPVGLAGSGQHCPGDDGQWRQPPELQELLVVSFILCGVSLS